MFFPKLRRRAKWVFLLLALAFAGGFLIFGVGAGGSGIGDYVADLFNRPVGGQGDSLEDARKAAAENPGDAQAQLELADAAQREGRVDEAISALERYRTLEPRDADQLRTLAALYGREVAEAQQTATAASNEAQQASLPKTIAPQDSAFLQAILGNKISESESSQAQARADAANQKAQRLAGLQLAVFRDLTMLVRDDPLLYIQFAQAAETAQDYRTAISAYQQFLDLAPNNPNAKQIRERIKLLESVAGQLSGGGSSG
jgi:tetratricopeptide (TPR) repeat protein